MIQPLARSGATVLLAAAFALACVARADTTVASDAPRFLVNRDRQGLAVQGYDVVAYFTDSEARLGDPRWSAQHEGATYRFASRAHLEAFEADPSAYAPAYGGYCAYAASINKISPVDPRFWEIVDGRLLLQHNQKAWDLWHEDAAQNLVKADRNWPGLVAKNAKPVKILVNVDDEGIAVQGYDVVAYITDGKPLKGSPEHESVYGGARYLFSSKAHRDTFELDPARYEPQFGGYCAYAASIGKVSPIDPAFWQIENGRLLLQHNQKAYDLFNEDTRKSLAKADANWPGLVERKGR